MIIGEKPVTEDEFSKTTGNAILKLPGQWETNNAVMSSLTNQVIYDLDDAYYQTYDQKIRNLSLEKVQQINNKIVRPEDMAFFVVGDKEKILKGLEELDLEIIYVDVNGVPINQNKTIRP
jgi:predicted Zn-dependent peptidase